MSEIVDITVNCPTLEDARRLSHVLLEHRMAACCNIGPVIESAYVWNGVVERAEEMRLSIKTSADLFERCAAVIREHHPYETPAIFGHRVSDADRPTRAWLDQTMKDRA